jgi:Domain of unknown function (DUF4157)
VRAQGLTEEETRALRALPLPVDLSRVRIHRGGGGRAARALRAVVLRCSRGRGIALGNDVFLPDDCCESLPVLAHELTHCGQYQAWGAVRYYVRAIADRIRELRYRRGLGASPYEYRMDAVRPFEQYGMEQQGQIVEDWFRGRANGLERLTPAEGDPPRAQRHSHRGRQSSP